MSDDALLHEFNRARSEQAFEALVQRHLRLVFATALRQVGDRSLAEEISQQVFLALARKAGRLGGHQTIAGWLYQTTLREAKRTLRTELRRQRRDQLALEVGALGHGSADEADGLLPLLDEALASLRESERLAVILRYFEGKSWREVGTELGASEDAVQKRGERALETLGRFFARHGFKVSAAALTTGLTTQASAAVPMTLAGVITQTALVPTASASTMGVLAMHLMNLTKTQTTVATLLVCAAPIAYETSARRAIETEHLSLQEQIDALRADLSEEESRHDSLKRETAFLTKSLTELDTPLPVMTDDPQLPSPKPEPKPEAWSDELPYVEVPKSVLNSLRVQPYNRDGKLTEEIVDVLAMTAEDSQAVQGILVREFNNWKGLRAFSGRYEPGYRPENFEDQQPVESFSMRYPAIPDHGSTTKARLETDLIQALGTERGTLFLQYSKNSFLSSFDWYGQREQIVTLARTGDPVKPVVIYREDFENGQRVMTLRGPLMVNPDGSPPRLDHVPPALHSIALRWFYSDRVR
jgi:RNA polymerase sigma factor (sigma-70 family)